MKNFIIFASIVIAFSFIASFSNTSVATEINRDAWTHQPEPDKASIIATYGYQKMKLVDTGSGKAAVVFTHINDREYCGGQDALFNPIEASINVELEIDKQLKTISLPALLGCSKGVSFAKVHDSESMEFIAMMDDADKVLFHEQEYTLKGFKAASEEVID